ncbi:MAG: YggS family pyridoxal phosphate-dependent enzyme [Ignavibacteria bacterium]|nr:YggS family pyridoxal phosphate-dependent enzyme [Ignavibacteria bacterium]
MISENITLVREKIIQKCRDCGRFEKDVKLIAVSKMHPAASIIEAKKSGLIHFGENKAQELKEKIEIIKEEVFWHFIGHLQTNKVKFIAGNVEMLHSVESEKLAFEINRRMETLNKVQKLLVEVNTSGEDSKYGIRNIEDLLKFADYCVKLENTKICGLMTMAPFTENKSIIKRCFEKTRMWKEYLNKRGYNLEELSMGMSNDFELAIEEGSTMVRIGSLIFGERNY